MKHINVQGMIRACGLVASVTLGLAAFTSSANAQSEGADPNLLAQPWAKWNYEDSKPVRGGYLRIASPLSIGKMNPNHWPVNDWIAMNYFHEKLLITDGSYRANVNWLAESYEYVTPTELVMKLRPSAAFNDGVPFTAENVKHQIDWIRDPANGAWSAGWLTPLERVEVVDEHTVKWVFKEPWAGFEGIMANVPGYALGMHALAKDADAYGKSPTSSGAYVVEDYSPDNYLKLKRNPNWWFAKASGNPDMPYFDGIHITNIPDPAVRLANLRAGTIDMLTLDKSQFRQMSVDKNFNVYRQPVPSVVGLRFNTQKGVLQDKRIRQAISMAIDRQAIIAGTQFGLGRVASGMYPEDHWAHNPALEPVVYDPEGARALLAEAGYADGLTIRGYYVNTTAAQGMVEAIKTMLAQVGIDWQVDLLAPTAASARMESADYDLAQGGWQWIYDPHLAAFGSYHPQGGFNHGRSNNPKLIELIEKGRTEVDPEKRRAVYHQLEENVYNEYEDVFLFWEETAFAMSKKLRGYDHEMWLQYKETFTASHPFWFVDGQP